MSFNKAVKLILILKKMNANTQRVCMYLPAVKVEFQEVQRCIRRQCQLVSLQRCTDVFEVNTAGDNVFILFASATCFLRCRAITDSVPSVLCASAGA